MRSTAEKITVVGYDSEIIDLLEACGYTYAGYTDKEPRKEEGYLGDDAEAAELECGFVFGMHLPAVRKKLWKIYEKGLLTLVSPYALVSEGVDIRKGTSIQHYCLVMPGAVIGRACQVNARASIHHDCCVGDFTTISPGALVLGRVSIGEGCYIGAGSVIRENCRIGDNAVIGAGAVVVSDVEPGTTVVGVPAKRLLKGRGTGI